MLTKIDTKIPTKTNQRILDLLYKATGWSFAYDETMKVYDTNKSDSGFILRTFDVYQSYTNHDSLNVYGSTIVDIIEENCFLKFKKINRLCWNWYHKDSVMEFHQDIDQDKNYSIIYNLHNNDGGTDIKINDKINFCKSNESEAILFPSLLWHKGIAPKENLNRFCLNIMVEI